MLLHAVLNASSEMWKVLPEYSGRLSATDAVAATVHVNLMLTIVLWAAAVMVMLIYGVVNLSRQPRQILSAASAESREPTTSRVR